MHAREHLPALAESACARTEQAEDEHGEAAQLVHGVHPEWRLPERVIAQEGEGRRADYLVKWRLLPYSEATWEAASSLGLPEDQARAHAAQPLVHFQRA